VYNQHGAVRVINIGYFVFADFLKNYIINQEMATP